MKFSFISALLLFNFNLLAQPEEGPQTKPQNSTQPPVERITEEPSEQPNEDIAEDEPADDEEAIEEDYRNAEMIDEREGGMAQSQEDCDCGDREEEQAQPSIFPQESVFMISPTPIVPEAPAPPPPPTEPDYSQPQVGPENYKQYGSGNYQYQNFAPIGPLPVLPAQPVQVIPPAQPPAQ